MVSWYKNQPKYSKGSAVLINPDFKYTVAIIEDIEIIVKTNLDKKLQEEGIVKRRCCLGNKSYMAKENIIKYQVNNEFIYECDIVGGIDSINKYLSNREQEISELEETLYSLEKEMESND